MTELVSRTDTAAGSLAAVRVKGRSRKLMTEVGSDKKLMKIRRMAECD